MVMFCGFSFLLECGRVIFSYRFWDFHSFWRWYFREVFRLGVIHCLHGDGNGVFYGSFWEDWGLGIRRHFEIFRFSHIPYLPRWYTTFVVYGSIELGLSISFFCFFFFEKREVWENGLPSSIEILAVDTSWTGQSMDFGFWTLWAVHMRVLDLGHQGMCHGVGVVY